MFKRISLAVALFASALLVHGAGYSLYSESATDVLSLGGATVARTGSASSAWYNPAATTEIDGTMISVGGTFLRLGAEYKTSTGSDHMKNRFRPTGFMYAVVPVADDMRFTLSMNAPYGTITQWKRGSQVDTMGTFTSIRGIYVTPGLAIRLNDQWSVGFGLNGVMAIAELQRYIDLNKVMPGLGKNKLNLEADALGFGGFLSVHYRPTEDWAFGAHIQTPVQLSAEGDASYRKSSAAFGGLLNFTKDDVHANLTFPGYIALGMENKSFENLTLLCDVVWTQWSVFDQLDIHFDSMPGTGGVGMSRSEHKYHDTFSFRFGAEYKLNENWVIRGGYMRDIGAANSRYRAPIMPDSSKHLFSIGAGYHTEKWGVDVAYGYSLFDQEKLGTAMAHEYGVERGEFNTDVHLLSAQLTYRF